MFFTERTNYQSWDTKKGFTLADHGLKSKCLPWVAKRVNEEIAGLVAWSLEHAASGIAPVRGYNGETFPPKSYRAELAGKTLALGWKPLTFD